MEKDKKIIPKNPKKIDITRKNKIQLENEKWIKYLKSLKS